MKETKAPLPYKFALAVVVLLNLAVWFVSKDARVGWAGVPPVPDKNGLLMATLGDDQLAYRFSALTLQNLGDAGGRVVPLNSYNYERLKGWFFVFHELDPRSNFVPMIAAYYFGATHDPENSLHIVDFLEVAGQDHRREKWRWLAQAVYMARYRAEDMDRALDLAHQLSDMGQEHLELPLWTRHMPSFVLAAQGEKQAARDLMEVILGSAEGLHPTEIKFMQDYLENELAED